MVLSYDTNVRLGWVSLAVGALSGLVLGLWSFDGPVPTPPGLEDYQNLSRRLLRLGHIAFFGLGILNLLLARDLNSTALTFRGKSICSFLMNFGNVALPLSLVMAAFWHPLKYLMPVPAMAVTLALVLCAWGMFQKGANYSQFPIQH